MVNHGSPWSIMVKHGFWPCFVEWHHVLTMVRFRLGTAPSTADSLSIRCLHRQTWLPPVTTHWLPPQLDLIPLCSQRVKSDKPCFSQQICYERSEEPLSLVVCYCVPGVTAVAMLNPVMLMNVPTSVPVVLKATQLATR